VSFHWTGSEPEPGGYYEVRMDGTSIGAAWFNTGLQQWEQVWKTQQVGRHTWQVALMATDGRTALLLSETRSLNVVGSSGGGGGPGPSPTPPAPPPP
jgi:hypothetical protein